MTKETAGMSIVGSRKPVVTFGTTAVSFRKRFDAASITIVAAGMANVSLRKPISGAGMNEDGECRQGYTIIRNKSCFLFKRLPLLLFVHKNR